MLDTMKHPLDVGLATGTFQRDFLLPGVLSALVGHNRTLLIATPGALHEHLQAAASFLKSRIDRLAKKDSSG